MPPQCAGGWLAGFTGLHKTPQPAVREPSLGAAPGVFPLPL